jgi:hypothetical protein
MHQYYTAILVVVSQNVGIPLAISVVPGESIELSYTFYHVFDSKFGTKLKDYILESDQGSALKAVGAHHPRHLLCLQHVLKSLRTKDCGRFAPLVGNLISAHLEKELRVLRRIYTLDFAMVCAEGENVEARLRRCLKKVRLLFVNDEIISMDQEHKRRNQVSMLARVGTKMTSTSNTIESVSGRINGKTPHFKAFWGSLHRPREAIMQKIENDTDCMRYKNKYEGRRAQRRFISVLWLEWVGRSLSSSVQMKLVSVVRQYWRPRCIEWIVLAAIVSVLIVEITRV